MGSILPHAATERRVLNNSPFPADGIHENPERSIGGDLETSSGEKETVASSSCQFPTAPVVVAGGGCRLMDGLQRPDVLQNTLLRLISGGAACKQDALSRKRICFSFQYFHGNCRQD